MRSLRRSSVGLAVALVALLAIGTGHALAGRGGPWPIGAAAPDALTPVTVSLSVTPNPSAPADTLSFHVVVSPNPHGGYVSIISGTTQLGTDHALGGNGTLDVDGFEARVGTWQMKACFLGTDQYASACSPDVSHTVAKLPTTTTLSLTPSTIAIGDTFSVHVVVSPAPGQPVDVGITGSRFVTVDSTGVGDLVIQPEWPYDHAGRFDVVAYFPGTLNLEQSQSTAQQLTIMAPEITPTTTTVSADTDPVPAGDSTCLKAIVSPPPGAGSVAFELTSPTGAVTTTSANWSELGWASVCREIPTAGTWTIVGKYTGDLGWLSSDSDPLEITAERRPTSVTVGGSDRQKTTEPFRVGVRVDDTGEVTSGQVTLWETTSGPDVLIGTQALDVVGGTPASATTFELPARPVGTYSFKASYAGTATKFLPSTGTGTVTVLLGLTPGTASIDGGATYTADALVDIAVPATGARAVALSNSGSLWKVLDPWEPTTSWSLTDPAYGGSDAQGVRHVYVQWQDQWYAWSDPVDISITWDGVAPSATAPAAKPRAGTSLASGGVPFAISWTGTDASSGIASYRVERSRDGGAWSVVTSATTKTTVNVTLAPGSTYRFRVRATDKAGNTGAWAQAATFTLSSAQESSSRISWSGTWRTASSSVYWGGAARYATAAGAKATFSFTGRSFAWISSVGPTRGTAQISVDGGAWQFLGEYASTTSHRRVLFVKTWSTSASHSVRIRVVGTAGHPRIDVDGFVIAR